MTVIDEISLLFEAEGTQTLDAIERELAPNGLTLGFAPDSITVAEWIAKGTPGAPSMLVDPADHVLAGLTAKLVDGRTLVIRPAPRRAVGPDLIALFAGGGGHFGVIERAWIRIHRTDARRVTTEVPAIDLDPPPSPEELAMWHRISL